MKTVQFLVDPLDNLADEYLGEISRENPAQTIVHSDTILAVWPVTHLKFAYILSDPDMSQKAHCYIQLENGKLCRIVSEVPYLPKRFLDDVPREIMTSRGKVTVKESNLEVISNMLAAKRVPKGAQKKSAQTISTFPVPRVPKKISPRGGNSRER